MLSVLLTEALVAGSLSGLKEGGSQCMTSQDTSQGSLGGGGKSCQRCKQLAVEGSLEKRHSGAFKGCAPGCRRHLSFLGLGKSLSSTAVSRC